MDEKVRGQRSEQLVLKLETRLLLPPTLWHIPE